MRCINTCFNNNVKPTKIETKRRKQVKDELGLAYKDTFIFDSKGDSELNNAIVYANDIAKWIDAFTELYEKRSYDFKARSIPGGKLHTWTDGDRSHINLSVYTKSGKLMVQPGDGGEHDLLQILADYTEAFQQPSDETEPSEADGKAKSSCVDVGLYVKLPPLKGDTAKVPPIDMESSDTHVKNSEQSKCTRRSSRLGSSNVEEKKDPSVEVICQQLRVSKETKKKEESNSPLCSKKLSNQTPAPDLDDIGENEKKDHLEMLKKMFIKDSHKGRKLRTRSSESYFFEGEDFKAREQILKSIIDNVQTKLATSTKHLEEIQYSENVLQKCFEAKEEELNNLHSLRELDKLDLTLLRESQASIAAANGILVGEIDKKNKELKDLKNKLTQQKNLVKKLMLSSDKTTRERANIRNKSVPTPKESLETNNTSTHNPCPIETTTSKQKKDANQTIVRPIEVVMNHKQKRDVYVFGDTSVRGLGTKIQSRTISGQVTVRGGASLDNVNVAKDLENLKDNSSVVFSYGLKEVDENNADSAIVGYESLIQTAEWSQHVSNIKVGILGLPSQKYHLRNKCVTRINNYLAERCRDSNVQFINNNLGLTDLGRDGIHTNSNGKIKTALKIRNFVWDSAYV